MRAPTARTYANATMYVGLVTTLGGNAATADLSDPLAVVIATLPAVGLALTFEMIMRGKVVPSRRRWHHRAARGIPALAIMGIAAYCSYGHLLTLAQAHGQTGGDAYLLAGLPDAMMLLAAVVLKDTPQTRKPVAKPAVRKPAARKPATPRKTLAPAAAAAPRVLGPVPALPVALPAARRVRPLAVAS